VERAQVHRIAGENRASVAGAEAAKAEGYLERTPAVARKQQVRPAMRLWNDQGEARQQAREVARSGLWLFTRSERG
jgi:hypothetical protein